MRLANSLLRYFKVPVLRRFLASALVKRVIAVFGPTNFLIIWPDGETSSVKPERTPSAPAVYGLDPTTPTRSAISPHIPPPSSAAVIPTMPKEAPISLATKVLAAAVAAAAPRVAAIFLIVSDANVFCNFFEMKVLIIPRERAPAAAPTPGNGATN